MDYLKQIETDLNNFETIKKSIDTLPEVIEQNKQKINVINIVLKSMDEQDRRIIQRICIDGKKPIELEKEFKMTERNIYNLKKSALTKFARMVYGVELWEEDNKKINKGDK